MSLALERRIVDAVFRKKSLWLAHFLGNAALAFLGYQWLGIPDRTAWQVALSALTGLALVALALWLHGATLAYFRAAHSGEDARPRVVWATARRLPSLAVWAVVVVVVSNVVLLLMGYRDPVANALASWLTLRLRRPVSPASMALVFGWLVWFAAYFKVLFMLLPWAESAAVQGFGAFSLKRVLSPARIALQPRYWLACAAAFLAGVVVPALLVHWAPAVGGISAETASLVIRFLLAYAMAITAWLCLASTLGAWGSRTEKP